MRVFISSVMKDFEAERVAAKEAVEALRQEPVMAEDFGAKPLTPQAACLEGVRQSDVYLGILGARYGSVGSSGLSATAEEFEEARRRGLSILCFEQKGKKEPDQEAFTKRIKRYEDGFFLATFSTPDELKSAVTKALYDLLSGQKKVSAEEASRFFASRNWGSQERPQHSWITLCFLPELQGEPFFSVLDFEREEFQERLLDYSFGPSRFFSRKHGTDTEQGAEHLKFAQRGHSGRAAAIIEIHTNGGLILGRELGDERGEVRDTFERVFLIDQDEAEQTLTQAFSYASSLLKELPRKDSVSSFFAAVSKWV